MTDGQILLKLDKVSQIYSDENDKQTEAVREVSLDIREGEFVSFIGASGCGKTTTLRMIAGLDKPYSGHIYMDGKEITGPDPSRGYVFQQGALFDWLTVEDNIAIGLKARGVYKENKHRIQELIDMTGLTGFEKSYPHQISGGMAQRVAIARALINEPRALLLDEPMGALDSFTRANLQDQLLELQRVSHATMVLVTHDVDEAIYLSDRIVIMTPRPGRIAEVINVDMRHPRNRGSEEFLLLRKKLLEKFQLASEQRLPEYMI
ncbi:MAG: ABC transporter ATP-binding protein [Eubacteriales bacterium]|jgi:NitT/TauT family transport system ATP-binding protein/sulfonate transport system ATP-binding protein